MVKEANPGCGSNIMRYLKKSRFTLAMILFCLMTNLVAQRDTLDAFRQDSLKIVRIKLVRPQFKFDNRVAFYGQQALDLTGFDVGVLLSEKLRLTLGYYAMKTSLKEMAYTKGEDKYNTLYELKYGSVNSELIYKDSRFFSLGMPLEIAAGLNTLREKNITTDQVISTRSGGLIFANFGVSGTFKPMRFLGLKGIVGYRKQIFNQVKDFNFDGFFTSIGLNIDVHEIITDIKMAHLMKKYHRGNKINNAVNILTD